MQVGEELTQEISKVPNITQIFFPRVSIAFDCTYKKFFDGGGYGQRVMSNILTQCVEQNMREFRIDRWSVEKRVELATASNRKERIEENYRNWMLKSLATLDLYARLQDWGGGIRISTSALEKAEQELRNQRNTFLTNAAFLGMSCLVGGALDKVGFGGTGQGVWGSYTNAPELYAGGIRAFTEVICFNPAQSALNFGTDKIANTNNGQTNGIKTTFGLIVNTDHWGFCVLDIVTDQVPVVGQAKLAFKVGFNVGMMIAQLTDIFLTEMSSKVLNMKVTDALTLWDIPRVRRIGAEYWYPNLLKSFDLLYLFNRFGGSPYMWKYVDGYDEYLDRFLASTFVGPK